jgi:hypothetical protein
VITSYFFFVINYWVVDLRKLIKNIYKGPHLKLNTFNTYLEEIPFSSYNIFKLVYSC